MKSMYWSLITVAAITLLLASSLEAIGRGGGGRAGGSGSGGGRQFSSGYAGRGKTMNRSPSLSRNTKPAPQMSQRSKKSRPHASKPYTRPSKSSKKAAISKKPRMNTPSRDQINQFLKDKPIGKPSERPSTLPDSRPDRGKPGRPEIGRPDRPDRGKPGKPSRPEVANKVRDKINDKYPGRSDWFKDDFWKDPDHRHPPSYQDGGNWWKWATAAGVASWFGWRNQPIYYGYDDGYYDDGYYSSYDDDSAYWEEPEADSPSAPFTDYSEQVEHIEAADNQNGESEWLPLGVFALTKESGETVAPNIYMQLAINRDGLISGTFYNTTTDQSYELEGLVDDRSQIAAWKMSESENSPIVETGIFNLTQEEAEARVTFADGQTQNIYLLRIEE